ncbi:hypothetical protein K2X33_09230 [bacterium]|nr:hypothetical protein [bacterium]
MRIATRHVVFAFVLWGLMASAPSFAQQASLEWNPIEGAVAYEIEVTRNGNSVIRKRLEAGKTQWAGNLPYGIYSFRLRAIDWAGQEGEWSEAQPLLASPPAPVLTNPVDKTLFPYDPKRPPILLAWKASPETRKYRVEIQRGGNPVRSVDTEALSYAMTEKVPGEYAFRVKPLLEAATGSARVAEGDASPWRFFTLGAPEEATAPATERFNTGVELVPTLSVFRVNVRKDAATQAVLVSEFNPGLDADVTYRLANHHSLFYSLRAVATTLSVGSGTLENPQQLLTTHKIGYGFRFAFFPRAAWRVFYGLGSVPTGHETGVASTFAYAPVVLHRAGMSLNTHLFSLLGSDFGLRTVISAFLPAQSGTNTYRGGIEWEFDLNMSGPLWGNARWNAFMGYQGMSVNSSDYQLLQDNVLMGLGAEYRF